MQNNFSLCKKLVWSDQEAGICIVHLTEYKQKIKITDVNLSNMFMWEKYPKTTSRIEF